MRGFGEPPVGGVPEQDPAPIFGDVTIQGLGQSTVRLGCEAPAEAGGPQEGKPGSSGGRAPWGRPSAQLLSICPPPVGQAQAQALAGDSVRMGWSTRGRGWLRTSLTGWAPPLPGGNIVTKKPWARVWGWRWGWGGRLWGRVHLEAGTRGRHHP